MPNANWFPRSRIAKGDAGRPNLHTGVASHDRDQFSATDRGRCFERLEANRLAAADRTTHGLPDDFAELGGATAPNTREATSDDFEIRG